MDTVSKVCSLSSFLLSRLTSQLCLQQGILNRLGQGPQKIFKGFLSYGILRDNFK